MMKVIFSVCILTVTVGYAFGVRCFVGAGNSISVMDCGTSSNKCVKSELSEIVGKICFSHMDWSKYPGFDTSVGCQRNTVAGINTEICICEGDECNGSVKAYASTMLIMLGSVVVTGYVTL